jgi:hypothetical protein
MKLLPPDESMLSWIFPIAHNSGYSRQKSTKFSRSGNVRCEIPSWSIFFTDREKFDQNWSKIDRIFPIGNIAQTEHRRMHSGLPSATRTGGVTNLPKRASAYESLESLIMSAT